MDNVVSEGTVPSPGLSSLGQIAVTVEDVERATHFYRDVTFIGEPHVVHKTDNYELSMAAFKDSEGNLMALMCESGQM